MFYEIYGLKYNIFIFCFVLFSKYVHVIICINYFFGIFISSVKYMFVYLFQRKTYPPTLLFIKYTLLFIKIQNVVCSTST